MPTFRGRAADDELAAKAARRPHLTTQNSSYAEIDWPYEGAEWVTDCSAGLRPQLQSVTGERLIVLEGIGNRHGRQC